MGQPLNGFMIGTSGIAVDGSGNVYVTGWSECNLGNSPPCP